MPVRESPVLLVGTIAQPAVNVYAYEDGKRTQTVRAKKVMVMTNAGGEFGVSEVSVPIEVLDQYQLGQGSSVVWWVRYGSYSMEGRGGTTCAAVAPADQNAPQLVHEGIQHMTGASEGGRRQASA